MVVWDWTPFSSQKHTLTGAAIISKRFGCPVPCDSPGQREMGGSCMATGEGSWGTFEKIWKNNRRDWEGTVRKLRVGRCTLSRRS